LISVVPILVLFGCVLVVYVPVLLWLLGMQYAESRLDKLVGTRHTYHKLKCLKTKATKLAQGTETSSQEILRLSLLLALSRRKKKQC
jgi:hypothetical protein